MMKLAQMLDVTPMAVESCKGAAASPVALTTSNTAASQRILGVSGQDAHITDLDTKKRSGRASVSWTTSATFATNTIPQFHPPLQFWPREYRMLGSTAEQKVALPTSARKA